MDRHLHLVPAGADLLEPEESVEPDGPARPETNVVDLDDERMRRRRYRYHPAAGLNWLDDLFDENDPDDDFPPPAC